MDVQSLLERGVRESDALRHLQARDTFLEAVQALEKAGDRQLLVRAKHHLAKAHFDEDNAKEAVAIWEELVEAECDQAVVYDTLLAHYANTGAAEDVHRVWELRQSRVAEPASASALTTAAGAYLAADPERGATLYEEARALEEAAGRRSAWVYARWGRALARADQHLEAAAVYLRGMAASADDDWARRAAGLYRAAMAALRRHGVARPGQALTEALSELNAGGLDSGLARLRQAGGATSPPAD